MINKILNQIEIFLNYLHDFIAYSSEDNDLDNCCRR